jgi:lipoteichoic acid synthase
MNRITSILIIFIIINSYKSITTFLEIGLNFKLLLAHIVTAVGFATMAILLTLKSRRRIWFATWYILHSVFLFVNINYFEFFGKFIHISNVYVLIPEAVVLAKNLAIPVDYYDIVFFVDLPLFIYLLLKHSRNEIPLPHFKAAMWTSLAATALASGVLFTVPIHYFSKSAAQAEDTEIVCRYGLIGHNLLELTGNSEDENSAKVKYGRQVESTGTPGQRPNVVLIQVESLDANIINYRYQGEYVVPFLHELSTKSLYFPFTLCYRKLGGTSDCEVAVNNSVEPLTETPLMMDENYQFPNSVAKVLKKAGYSTDAFHGSGGWYYKRLSAYAAMGYDNFHDPKVMNLQEKGWGVPDREVFNYVEKYLQKGTKPFFASVITMTSHEPFNNFKHFVPDKRFDTVEPKITGRYFASIAYTDRAVGEFVTKMRKEHPNTYFFLYGDHTPYVINDGPFRRSVTRDKDEKEMVPLFVITPGGQRRYEQGAVASYLDIAPTILHAARIPYKFRSLGVDLLSDTPLQQQVAYRGHPYSRSELFQEIAQANQGKPAPSSTGVFAGLIGALAAFK